MNHSTHDLNNKPRFAIMIDDERYTTTNAHYIQLTQPLPAALKMKQAWIKVNEGDVKVWITQKLRMNDTLPRVIKGLDIQALDLLGRVYLAGVTVIEEFNKHPRCYDANPATSKELMDIFLTSTTIKITQHIYSEPNGDTGLAYREYVYPLWAVVEYGEELHAALTNRYKAIEQNRADLVDRLADFYASQM